MKASLLYAIAIFAFTSLSVSGQMSSETTRATLARAAQASPSNPAALTAYAEFLDRYGDPGVREAYGKLLASLQSGSDQARTAAVARKLAVLDLMAGDRAAA